jgi:hypothetical protein
MAAILLGCRIETLPWVYEASFVSNFEQLMAITEEMGPQMDPRALHPLHRLRRGALHLKVASRQQS